VSGYNNWHGHAAAYRNKIAKQRVRAIEMIEFFTVFYLEYTYQGRDIKTYITLPNSEACQIFIRDNEDMSEYMFADGDVNMWCLDTGVMSRSIRPKLRPE